MLEYSTNNIHADKNIWNYAYFLHTCQILI